LVTVAARALVERDAGGSAEAEAEAMRKRWLAWLEQTGLVEHMEPFEAHVLGTPVGGLQPQQVSNAVWLAESAQVLLWALSVRELPAIDGQEHPFEVAKACEIGNPGAPLLQAATLRPLDEIERMRRTLFGVHWRIRDQQHNPGHTDMSDVAAKGIGGVPFALDGIQLGKGDLVVRDTPIQQATPELLGFVASIAMERHRAANWLVGVHPVLSRVPTAT
jgi:hypothetical protein